MTFFISDALAQTPAVNDAAAPASGGSFSLIMIAAIFILFYFMLIRPQNKRAKEHKDLVDKLKEGDEITTAAGLLGKVTKVDEQFIKVKIADGVEVSMLRSAVNSVLPKGTIKSA